MSRTEEVECDVLVIGSGAAGMSAALAAAHQGLQVVVVEKSEYLGGTTAISGGWLWVPGNKQGVDEGDTRDEAEAYIRALAGASYRPERLESFLDTVPEALDFLGLLHDRVTGWVTQPEWLAWS